MAGSLTKDIQQHIKDHTFSRVYLLTGDEGYQINQAKHALVDALVPEGDTMNYHPYQADTLDFQEISELAVTYPFFSEKRVIVLDGINLMKAGKDILPDLFQRLPESTCMIIISEKADKRSSVFRWVKKNGYVAEVMKKDLKEADLRRFVGVWLKKAGKKMLRDDASYLANLVGNDLYLLNGEVSKLIAYAGNEEVIGRNDIDAIVSPRIEDKIFELTEAIAAGKHDLVMTRYREMIMVREPPLRILYMMIRQYRIMLVVYDMSSRREPDDQVAKAAGIPPFAVRKTRGLLRGYDRKSLSSALDFCLETETKIKTGFIDDQIGLESLLVRLTDRV